MVGSKPPLVVLLCLVVGLIGAALLLSTSVSDTSGAFHVRRTEDAQTLPADTPEVGPSEPAAGQAGRKEEQQVEESIETADVLQLRAEVGHCLCWTEPGMMVFLTDFSIELWYRTVPSAARLGPPEIPLALFSNLRLDNQHEQHSEYYGRHFQLLLDDVQDPTRGTVLVQWMAAYSGIYNGRLAGKKVITDGLWHHIAVHRSVSSQTVTLIVDQTVEGVAEMPRGIDLETQDQSVVIGGCYNRRYREGQMTGIRVRASTAAVAAHQPDLFMNRSQHTEEEMTTIADYRKFSANSAYVRDGSVMGNDALWGALPSPMEQLAFSIVADDFPGTHMASAFARSLSSSSAFLALHNHSSSINSTRKGLVLTSLLSGGHGSQILAMADRDAYYAPPHYFVMITADCRRLRLLCVFVYDNAVIPEGMARALHGPFTQFLRVPEGPPVRRRDGAVLNDGWMRVAVGRRFAHYLHVLEDHPEAEYMIQLDARDSRINKDPFPYMAERNNDCDLHLQRMQGDSGGFCGGVQGGNRRTIQQLFEQMVEYMMTVPSSDDQLTLNVVVGRMGNTRVCAGRPFANHQQTRVFLKQTLVEHGNWFSDRRGAGRRDESPPS